MSGNFFTDTIRKDSRYLSTKCIDDINLLEPVFRAKVLKIVAEAKELGLKLMVFETYRSQQRQEQLFKKKKIETLKRWGCIITAWPVIWLRTLMVSLLGMGIFPSWAHWPKNTA